MQPRPPDWSAHVTYWQIEFHQDEGPGVPVGLACVACFDFDRPIDRPVQYLYYVNVLDLFRRVGIGRALVHACRKRWPKLTLTDPVSPEGKALLQSVQRQGDVSEA
jgi:GNAT superfamily N-acetyltransferase